MGEAKYRRDIQALRGLAVLAVVLFHAKESFFPLGYLGVDVFFVISGYVVTPLVLRIFADSTNKNEIPLSNLKDFFKRRFYRLAPALGMMLIISAVLIFLLGPIDDHRRFAKQGIATILLAGNYGSYKYSGDYFSPNPNPLVHTWSLSVEEQFYIFLPLALFLTLSIRNNWRKASTYLLLGIFTISFTIFMFPSILEPIFSQIGLILESQFSFYSPIHRFWQFALGSLAFLFLGRHSRTLNNTSWSVNMALCIALIAILIGPIQFNLSAGSILAAMLATFVISFKSLDVLPPALIKLLEWVGDRSYSIYLYHMPFLYIAKFSPAVQLGTSESRRIQISIAIVASILFGAFSFSTIENWFRNKGKRSKNSLSSITLVALVSILLPLALFLTMERGLDERYWGLDRNTPKVEYAGELDPDCSRDSTMGPPCFYITPGATKSVLLIGDSHAGHLSQAVIDAAKSQGWNSIVWTHSGCHVQFERSVSLSVPDYCVETNNQMKTWVVENKPSAIIVSQFVYSHSNQGDLRNALSALYSIVPSLLLIENNPVFPDDEDFMVQRPIVMAPYNPPKRFVLSNMQKRDEDASDQLAHWARRVGISTLNIDSLFCNLESCERFSENGWLYRDADHLSIAGAALAIPLINSFLSRI